MTGPTERPTRDEPGDRAPPSLDPDAPAAGETAVSGHLVPHWLVNLAALGWRVLAIAGLVLALGAITATLWNVTASILVAVIVSAVFAPLVLRLRDRGRSRTASATRDSVVQPLATAQRLPPRRQREEAATLRPS